MALPLQFITKRNFSKYMKTIMNQKLCLVEKTAFPFGAENGESPFFKKEKKKVSTTMQHIIDAN